MSENQPSIEGLSQQIDNNCAEFDAADFNRIGTALGNIGVGHIKDLLRQLRAAVNKLSTDQETLSAAVNDAYVATEFGTMALKHTTEGTNNEHALLAREAAFTHDFNVGHLRGEVRGMGGGDSSDPIQEAKEGVIKALAAMETYEGMVVGVSTTVEQVAESRQKIHGHIDDYKASL